MIEHIFGKEINRVQCPDRELYKNRDLTYSLDKVFALPEMQTQWKKTAGASMTTAEHSFISLQNLPGAGPLTDWIVAQMSVPRKVRILNSWANRLFPGWTGYGTYHNHLDQHHVDLVGIFYVDVPTVGAQLIFLNDDGEKHYIQPTAGELIIHSASNLHSVGNHTENMVRTVFVFDTVYVD